MNSLRSQIETQQRECYAGWCIYGKNMKILKYWDNDKCPCCLTTSVLTVQHMFKCKELEMRGYKDELYKHMYTWLKEQDMQWILLDMIMATLFKQPFELPKEYKNYRGSTRQNLQKITQLQVMQGFLSAGNMAEVTLILSVYGVQKNKV